MQVNKPPQFKPYAIQLFDELQPSKQCSKNVLQEPLKHGFEMSNMGVAFRGVKAPNNGPIISYEVISNDRISYAQNLQGFMSENVRSLLLECRTMIEDLNELRKNQQNRSTQPPNITF